MLAIIIMTECRYCHTLQLRDVAMATTFWFSMGYNFNCMIASDTLFVIFYLYFICIVFTFCVSRRRRKMYCGHARLCVCLSAAVLPHYCMDPDVTWGHGRGCPLVVHYWADLQSGHGLRYYGNITRTLVRSLRSSPDITT